MHKRNEEKKGGRKREKTCTNKKVCVQCVGNSRKLICCAENSIELNGYAIKQVQEQKYIAIQFNELIPNENSQNEMRNESIRSEMLKNWDEKNEDLFLLYKKWYYFETFVEWNASFQTYDFNFSFENNI